MQVTCPYCTTRYVLLESLLGPQGAKVRCPRCRESFSVTASGIVSGQRDPNPAAPALTAANGDGLRLAVNPTPEPALAPAPVSEGGTMPAAASRDEAPSAVSTAPVPVAAPAGVADSESPMEVARAVLGELEAHSGEAIARAAAEGKLFTEFGAVIAEAYEFYRRRIGPGADPAPFRAALRELWGVDLEAAAPRDRR